MQPTALADADAEVMSEERGRFSGRSPAALALAPLPPSARAALPKTNGHEVAASL